MKKMMLTLAIAVSTFCAFAGEVNVNEKVLAAFKTEFKSAKDVKWTQGSNYYEAVFLYNEKYLFAYYNTEGELLGLTRYISPLDLPITLQKTINEKYQDYWISDLFEVAKNDGTSYYITLENAGTKLVLKSTDSYTWNNYKKEKKI
jgi:hypothetical protein